MTGLAKRLSFLFGASSLRTLSISVLWCSLGVNNAHATEALLETLRTEQVVVVTAKEWGSTIGTLVAFERIQGTWKRTEIGEAL